MIKPRSHAGHAVVSGGLVLALAALAGAHGAESNPGCEKWDIDGLRLGMTLAEVQELHPKAKRSENVYMPDNLGKSWYKIKFAPSDWHLVLPEDQTPESKVKAIMTRTEYEMPRSLGGGKLPEPYDEIRRQLTERWGDPGDPVEVSWLVFPAFTYFDEACGLRAIAIVNHTAGAIRIPESVVVLIEPYPVQGE